MGHYVAEPNVMFKSVRYNTKTTAEIREAMERKIVSLRTLIDDRKVRVRRIREDYRIDAEQLAVLLIQFQKSDSGFISYEGQGDHPDRVMVPAGVIANIVREREMIDSEREQIHKMELVLRNIREEELYVEPRTGEVKRRLTLHQLTDSELEYLGF